MLGCGKRLELGRRGRVCWGAENAWSLIAEVVCVGVGKTPRA